ncbi:MAG: PKD domain-containing protein [Sandaracinaceae bacterium]|nr:PKD domain-containing protein [Myxococcales bacterium]MCB9658419.1 PKD domain-containing protein [Sandaracinaceae bacterium]
MNGTPQPRHAPRRGRAATPLATLLALLASQGCGARDGITTEAPDASRPGAPVEVDCGRSVQYTAPRQTLELVATAESESPIIDAAFTFIEGPGMPTLEPPSGPRALFTPTEAGTHLVRFEATNADGRAASCDITVEAVVGPPVAICPEDSFRTPVDSAVLLEGAGFDDDAVVGYQWDVVRTVAGASPVLQPRTEPVTQFESDVAGEYLLRLTVYDEEGATDDCFVPVTVTDRPTVICPEGPIAAPTRQPVALEAVVMDDGAVVRETWEVVTRPQSSSASPTPSTSRRTTLTPDRVGEYRLRFTAEDQDGFTDSCEVSVIGTETPPSVMCPAVIETTPLTPTAVNGSAVDDGVIRSAGWTVIGAPTGSAAGPPRPADNVRTVYTPDIAGEYTLRLRVQDDSGHSAECTTLVRAVATEGLRVEIFWDTNGTDMDTHLLHPDARTWNSSLDCYYGNCIGGLSWSAPGQADDPRLDIDDVDGFGPENINIMTPAAGTYRVGVHSYRGDGRVTVRIYCGGSASTPRRTFGPTRLSQSDLLWRVADVTISPTGCVIDELGSVRDFSRTGEPR